MDYDVTLAEELQLSILLHTTVTDLTTAAAQAISEGSYVFYKVCTQIDERQAFTPVHIKISIHIHIVSLNKYTVTD